VERNDRHALFSVIPTSAFVMSPLLLLTMASGDVSDHSDVHSSAGDADDARPEITGN